MYDDEVFAGNKESFIDKIKIKLYILQVLDMQN